VIQHGEPPSLRPYLEHSGAGFFLNFIPGLKEESVDKKTSFPFAVVSEKNPFYRIIDAEVTTDAGSPVKKVFVLIQHDAYPFPEDPVAPLTNREVETCWQKALACGLKSGAEGSAMLLAEQIGGQGEADPFEPLFFCKNKKLFFPPVCSFCGSALRQCYDDDVLARGGLQSYSGSLKRYLYCPSCLDLAGTTDFYTYRLDSADSSTVKDRWGLIQDFGKLELEKGRSAGFPCSGCADYNACYGEDGLVTARISTVAFYPFYMMVIGASSLNGADFLSLVSGAEPEALEKRLAGQGKLGRVHLLKTYDAGRPERAEFFFQDDERFFLEILYLKLIFLADFVEKVWPRLETYQYPYMGISLESMWVDVPKKGNLLPLFWNFEGTIEDIGGRWHGAPPVATLHTSQGLYHLGMAWFHALVGNERQGQAEIYEALASGLCADDRVSKRSFQTACGEFLDSVFSPENLFWQPQAMQSAALKEEWLREWKRALSLGWSLVSAGFQDTAGWAIDSFRKEVGDLHKSIKKRLFAPGVTDIGEAESLRREEARKRPWTGDVDRAVHDILIQVGRQWRVSLEEAKSISEETGTFSQASIGQGEETADMESTVVLKGGQVEDDMAETVVISPVPGMSAFSSDVSPDVMPETVIMSPAGQPPASSQEMEETVIISTGMRHEDAPDARRSLQSSGDETDAGKMASTIVSGLAGKEAKDDVDLAETVIIRPPKKEDT